MFTYTHMPHKFTSHCWGMKGNYWFWKGEKKIKFLSCLLYMYKLHFSESKYVMNGKLCKILFQLLNQKEMTELEYHYP